jgi:hypothetical protein
LAWPGTHGSSGATLGDHDMMTFLPSLACFVALFCWTYFLILAGFCRFHLLVWFKLVIFACYSQYCHPQWDEQFHISQTCILPLHLQFAGRLFFTSDFAAIVVSKAR